MFLMMTGAHGVGKTTLREGLLPKIEAAYSIAEITNVSRNQLAQMGLSSLGELKGQLYWQFQNALIRKQLHLEQELLESWQHRWLCNKSQIVISDRSTIDYMAYARLYGPREAPKGLSAYLTAEALTLLNWHELLRSCKAQQPELKYKFVHVRPFGTPPKQDGIRASNRVDQIAIDVMIGELLGMFRDEGSRLIMHTAADLFTLRDEIGKLRQQEITSKQHAKDIKRSIERLIRAASTESWRSPGNGTMLVPTQFDMCISEPNVRLEQLHAIIRS